MVSLRALPCVAHRGKRSQWDKAMAELLRGLGRWVEVQVHARGYSMLARMKYMWCGGHWIGIPS